MRTLLDLSGTHQGEIIERYLDDAHRRRLIAIRRFQKYLSEPDVAQRSGAALLRELLSYRDPDAPIDSDLETIFFKALRDHGLPLPVPQHPVMTRDGQKFIDFAYPDIGLAIELDGYADRANRAAFDRDRARQNVVEELGWSFRRFTWTQVREQPSGTACTVGLALGFRPVRWKT